MKSEGSNKIRYERGDATIDTTEIQRIIGNYYEQLYANKLGNLKEMDKFLDTLYLPWLSPEETENFTKLLTTNKIESVIGNIPTVKSSRSDGFSGKFYWTFKKELIPILSKVFQKIEEDRRLPSSFLPGQYYPNSKMRHRERERERIEGTNEGRKEGMERGKDIKGQYSWRT